MGETTDSIRRDIDRERNQFAQNVEGIEARVKDTTEQVQHKVEDVQHQVQDKVDEVQQKVKNAADWRAQFDQRPMVGLAVAFGGGVLLASMMGGGDKDRHRGSQFGGGYQPRFQSQGNDGHAGYDVGRQHVSSTFDNVKGALLGVAAAQLKTVLGQSLPGFDDEYRQVENETRSRQTGSSQPSSATNTQSQTGYSGETRERRQEI